jgi:F0F1-type ATP synthase membrane subunit c/vacuolar-type H+-ATPase subunit K
MDAAIANIIAFKALGAGIAVIALAGVGIGIGNIFSALVTAVARNPSARDQVFGLGILGFALTEAVALFALLIAFLILFT